ncbi:sensor histidine kinase [Chitinophaga horti]|uniref:histidine kinase n=1 Tax=Chitinophaga horti TaxID=2920382 RepID=A0ABY6J7F0_9BACT|nr:sensor histidine kinase [Chitinophaga horti]UYQ95601.1 sensor histidine kinase [Chitinophaga horti]
MKLFIFVCLFCCLHGLVKGQTPDTTTITQLLTQAERLLPKPAESRAARALLEQAMLLSRQQQYKPGIERASELQVQLALKLSDDAAIIRNLPALPYSRRNELMRILVFRLLDRRQVDSAMHLSRRLKEEAIAQQQPFLANDAEYYIARCHQTKGELRLMKDCYVKMAAFHRNNKDEASELITWTVLNSWTSENDTSQPLKLNVQEKVAELSKRLGKMKEYALILSDIAQSHLLFGRVHEAEKNLLEAAAMLEKMGVKERYNIYESLARLYVRKAHVEKALLYARLGQHNRRQAGSVDSVALHALTSEVYTTFGMPDRYFAEQVQMLADRDAYTERHPGYIERFARLIEYQQGTRTALTYLEPRLKDATIFRTNRQQIFPTMMLGDMHLRLKDTLAAMQYFRKAVTLLDPAYSDRDDMPQYAYFRMASGYYIQKKYDSSLIYLQKMQELNDGQIHLYHKPQMFDLLMKVNSAMGRYQAALRHAGRHQQLRDSIYNVQRWAQLEEIETKYETEKKDQQLKQQAREVAWLTQQTALRDALMKQKEFAALQSEILIKKDMLQAQQEARMRGDSLKNKEERIRTMSKEAMFHQTLLRQTRATRNAVITGAALLLVSLLLVYNRYRLKQRTNRELQQQRDVISVNNTELSKLVKEKEWLLKEVHHRVKNNLQVVMSLLNIQSHYLEDDRAISAIRDSQRRVNAISLIHKKLYQSDNPAVVNIGIYIQELLEHLREYTDMQQGILLKTDIAPVSLDIARALPIGLLLNESITNAMKYAFPDNTAGEILISLQKNKEAGSLTLLVADNGVGCPDAPGAAGKSLGMSLMDALAQDLGGELVVESDGGMRVSVTFPVE